MDSKLPKNAKIHFDSDYVFDRYFTKKHTANDIAESYGCTNVTVLNFIRSQGWEVRGFRECQRTTRKDMYDDKHIAKYKKLYLAGESFDSIACRFRLSSKKLSTVAKEQGWFISRSDWVKKFLIDDYLRQREIKRKLKQSKAAYTVSYSEFNNVVHYLTKLIKPLVRKPRSKFVLNLDHRLSIHDAYYRSSEFDVPVTVYELAHPCNLQYLAKSTNQIKNYRSDIEIFQLRSNIRDYNAEFGDPFVNIVPNGKSALYPCPRKYHKSPKLAYRGYTTRAVTS